jgi:peptide/nickel transport system substrate-binding protein
MKKKKYCFIFLVIVLIGSVFSNFNLQSDKNTQNVENIEIINTSGTIPFIYGTDSAPTDLDPHLAFNKQSIQVIDQVCERLFTYNLTNSSLPVIPQLASDFGTWEGPNLDGTWNYTVSLRSDVYFHDGTLFNATAVKWSFDRLHYFIEQDLTNIAELYRFYNTLTQNFALIINRTEIVNEFEVRFVLNQPYAPFEDLLTFSGSSILSPDSTPFYNVINTATGDLVGTGPFVYDRYLLDTQVDFHAFENYWDGKADIDSMMFKVIENDNFRNDALLNGSIHFIDDLLTSFYNTFETDPDIILLDSGIKGTTIYYLDMNNNWINSTLRQAISYAINYTDIIENYMEGQAERLRSPIPNGIHYANSTFDAAYFNITKARMIMQSIGYGIGLDPIYPGLNESEWTSSTFESFNFTYWSGNPIREYLSTLLTNNLSLIGIEVIPAVLSYGEWAYRFYELFGFNRNMLQLNWIGWGVDYNDPSNVINNLLTNRTSAFNAVRYNGYEAANETGRDPYDINDNVQLLMEAALFEINPSVRKGIYDRIQELLVEEDMPMAYGFVQNMTYAHNVNLSTYPENGLSKIYFYPCEWNAPDNILSSPTNLIAITDSWNQISLQWTDTESNEDGFRIQRKLGVTGTYTEIATVGPNINTYIDTDLIPGGIYYYRVQSYNFTLGSSDWSNEGINTTLNALAPILNVITPNPDTDGDIFLNWSDVEGATSYNVYRDTTFITDISGMTPIAQPTSSQYDDNGLNEGTYFYVITGENAGEETPISNCESVLVDLPPPDAPVLSTITPNPDTDGNVFLDWNDVSYATSYNIYRANSLITDISGLTAIGASTSSQYNDNGLTDGIYYYVITAVNATGESLISNCESVTVEIPSPFIPGTNLYTFLPILLVAVIGLVISFKKKFK